MPEQTNSCLGRVDVSERGTAPTKDSAQGHSLSHFLRLLFRLLDEHQIRYCVLHSWEGLPDKLPSDLDLAVHPGDRARLPFVFQELQDKGYPLVQCLNYFAQAYYFVFFWFEDDALKCVAVDVIFEHRRSGLISLSGEELIAGRERFKEFWVASPATEFVYLLAKRTWKKSAPPPQAQRLKLLVDVLGRAQAEKLAGKVFIGKLKAKVVEACVHGCLDKLLGRIGAQPWLTSLLRHPAGLVRFLFGEGLRVMRRWLQPTGLLVVVLGPDGVGKSTLVGRISQAFGPCFRRYRIFHWRPMLIARRRKTGLPNPIPHGEPPRMTLGSITALFGVFADYWLGYLLVLRPFIARSGLIVFDRYFQDMLVDPLRFRYAGPAWLPKLLSGLVPLPDVVFLVLDAEEEVILSRKREVPLEELRRQRASYRQLTGDIECAELIRADQGTETTYREACHFIVEHLVQRFQRRNARWLAPTR